MAEITDDDILATAEALVKDLALTGDDRDVITLAVQRLVWPPSPHDFLHRGTHISLVISRRADGSGWHGQLRCPHGCARKWTVYAASGEDAIFQALAAAHTEYRTGRSTSEPAPRREGRRMSLDEAVRGRRTEYVEVHDDRLTGADD